MIPRKDLYDQSDPKLPNARAEERQIMIDLLGIEPHHAVCDVPAWGGYLAEGITNVVDRKQIICVEPSTKFAAGINRAFTVHCAQQHAMPLADASVDRIGSMVGLHHMIDKLACVREAFRVLRPGGRLAFSEVVEDTAVARFLNGPVHAYATNGHRGSFMRPGESRDLLAAAGCVHLSIVERLYHLHWMFPSIDVMVSFCKGLFGLTKATDAQVIEALTTFFDVKTVDGIVQLPWSLVYCAGTKPDGAL